MSIPDRKTLSKVLVNALLSLLGEVSTHRLPLPLLKLRGVYYLPRFQDIFDQVTLEYLGLLIGIRPAILLLRHLVHAALLVLFILRRLILCKTLISLVQSPSWDPQLDIIYVDGPILITDDHVVVRFDSDALIASDENSQAPNYFLFFLIGKNLLSCSWTMVMICLERFIINVIGGDTQEIISALFLFVVIVHARVKNLLSFTEGSGSIIIIILSTASMRNQI